MGTYTELKKKVVHPWFRVACDLKAGLTKLPCDMGVDFNPAGADSLNIIDIEARDTGDIYVRAESAKEARKKADVLLTLYLDMKKPRRRKSAA